MYCAYKSPHKDRKYNVSEINVHTFCSSIFNHCKDNAKETGLEKARLC